MARNLGRDTKMADVPVRGRRSRSNGFRRAFASAVGICLVLGQLATGAAVGQTLSTTIGSSQVPTNWRDIKDGVGGYPAGPMLEIALRHTHADKLEMFKWRSEFIAMLSAQPGPLVEREWHSIWGLPANTGAGTWTGRTWPTYSFPRQSRRIGSKHST
jgi:hypothetical protein